MSSSQKHRGQHAEDSKLFAPATWKSLNDAVDDLAWLWTRGYSHAAGLSIVGDRYRLNIRQREAIRRAACSDQALLARPERELGLDDLAGRAIAIDGYNLLITIESGLSNGYVIACRDGVYRDMAAIHGTYRRVEETLPALAMIATELRALGAPSACWYLDKPVANSGRLKGYLLDTAQEYAMDWEVELVNNPDRVLMDARGQVVLSSDSVILDHTEAWANVGRYLIERLPDPHILTLQGNRFTKGCGL